MNKIPTIFHITHWKAGSQWVAEILKHSAPERFVPWQVDDKGLPRILRDPIEPGKVYGTAYLSYDEFKRIIGNSLLPWSSFTDIPANPQRVFNNWVNFGINHQPVIIFVIIRDLRDTLISFYFSAKNSHLIMNEEMAKVRSQLNELNEEDGLMDFLKRPSFERIVKLQLSWVSHAKIPCFHYEDILDKEYSFFERLVDYCKIEIPNESLKEIVNHNIFENVTGRKRGEENISMHLRKGVAGDWRNHFTGKIKDEFKKRYGHALIDTGYEKDINW